MNQFEVKAFVKSLRSAFSFLEVSSQHHSIIYILIVVYLSTSYYE